METFEQAVERLGTSKIYFNAETCSWVLLPENNFEEYSYRIRVNFENKYLERYNEICKEIDPDNVGTLQVELDILIAEILSRELGYNRIINEAIKLNNREYLEEDEEVPF